MQTAKLDEPFTLVMEGPFCEGGPVDVRCEVTCMLRRVDTGGGRTEVRIFVMEVRDLKTKEVIRDESILPSVPDTIRAMQLRDWASVYEQDVMADDSRVYKDTFKFM